MKETDGEDEDEDEDYSMDHEALSKQIEDEEGKEKDNGQDEE